MKDRVSPGMAVAIVGVAVFLIVAVLFGFTVVSEDEEAALTVVFDPAAYVEDNWDAVRTAIKEDAVPLADILGRIEPAADGTVVTEELIPVAEELGVVASKEAQVYRVSGTGTVSDVDVESSKGSIGIDLDGYDGPIALRLWVGTRIPSDNSSVRDASGFIEFGDFRDQTEYGKVAKEINKKVAADLESMDKESLQGKHIDFTGAFTNRTFNQPTIDISGINVVPIEVTES